MKASVRKYMCVLVVRGTYRKWFLSRKKEFEVSFYYTPVKKRVIDYHSDDLALSALGLGQIIGHDVSELESWALMLGHDTSHILK